MTKDYARYVDGFAIGPASLACGLAAAKRCAVITPDVVEDPRWSEWSWLASRFGYRACWSFPVEANGRVLGTFAMYYGAPTEAKARDLEFASLLSRTAAKIISSH
ncbi:GAF domain-containing protein [Bradyrhizobium sp. UFLA05-112]